MGQLVNNVNVDEPAAATEITFYANSGSTTATKKYLNLVDGFARKVNVVPDKAVLLTKVNEKDFSDARTVGTPGFSLNLQGRGAAVIDSITLKTISATTHIEVIML